MLRAGRYSGMGSRYIPTRMRAIPSHLSNSSGCLRCAIASDDAAAPYPKHRLLLNSTGMTAENFNRALEAVLQEEGGFSNDPQDPGGVTNLGITQRTMEDWAGHPVTLEQMQALTAADVAPIYKARYWDAVNGDGLPSGVDLLTFDGGVNCGPSRSAKWLQGAAGATQDGVIGPHTLEAVNAAQQPLLIDSASLQRRRYYEGLPTFDHFGRGWLARLDRMTKAAHEWSEA